MASEVRYSGGDFRLANVGADVSLWGDMPPSPPWVEVDDTILAPSRPFIPGEYLPDDAFPSTPNAPGNIKFEPPPLPLEEGGGTMSCCSTLAVPQIAHSK